MKKIIILLILLFVDIAYAGPSIRGTSEGLWPSGTEVIQLLDTATTVAPGDTVNTKFLPDQGAWELITTGTVTTFTVLIETSIRCVTDSYHAVSEMNESTLIRYREIEFSGQRCVRANITAITGGGSIDVYYIPRGN